MKTLDLIRYLCMNTLVGVIEITDRSGESKTYTSCYQAIHELASIDPSWYDEYRWNVENYKGKETHERDILFISNIL